MRDYKFYILFYQYLIYKRLSVVDSHVAEANCNNGVVMLVGTLNPLKLHNIIKKITVQNTTYR